MSKGIPAIVFAKKLGFIAAHLNISIRRFGPGRFYPLFRSLMENKIDLLFLDLEQKPAISNRCPEPTSARARSVESMKYIRNGYDQGLGLTASMLAETT